MSNPDRLPNLSALLEAASPPPWDVGISIDVEYGPWPVMRIAEMRDSTDQREVQANRQLAALAHDLGKLVLVMGAALEQVGSFLHQARVSSALDTGGVVEDLVATRSAARNAIQALAALDATLPAAGTRAEVEEPEKVGEVRP